MATAPRTSSTASAAMASGDLTISVTSTTLVTSTAVVVVTAPATMSSSRRTPTSLTPESDSAVSSDPADHSAASARTLTTILATIVSTASIAVATATSIITTATKKTSSLLPILLGVLMPLTIIVLGLMIGVWRYRRTKNTSIRDSLRSSWRSSRRPPNYNAPPFGGIDPEAWMKRGSIGSPVLWEEKENPPLSSGPVLLSRELEGVPAWSFSPARQGASSSATPIELDAKGR